MLCGSVVTRPPIILTSGHFFFSGWAALVQHSFIYSFVCLVLPLLGKAIRWGQDDGGRTGVGARRSRVRRPE